MMSTDDRLVYMLNQIARNLAPEGSSAALAVAEHLVAFWDPRMRENILAMANPALDPIAAQAIDLLRARRAVPPQSEAAVLDGASDVG